MSRPVVEIVWEDAAMHAEGWKTADAYRRLLEDDNRQMRTTGYLVEDNENYIAVSASEDPRDHGIADVMQIPRPLVKSVRRLRK